MIQNFIEVDYVVNLVAIFTSLVLLVDCGLEVGSRGWNLDLDIMLKFFSLICWFLWNVLTS